MRTVIILFMVVSTFLSACASFHFALDDSFGAKGIAWMMFVMFAFICFFYTWHAVLEWKPRLDAWSERFNAWVEEHVQFELTYQFFPNIIYARQLVSGGNKREHIIMLNCMCAGSVLITWYKEVEATGSAVQIIK